MPDFTAVDPDVLDERAAYGPEPESAEDRAERLSRAFEHGATLRLDAPPIDAPSEPVGPEELTPTGRRRRRRGPSTATASKRAVGGAQMGTLFVAGFAILISFTVGEWAVPTEVEANAIAAPLGNILARRIDIASKLGRDADDTIMLAVALMAYTARVGPIAAGRATNAWTERRNATRVDRPPEPIRSANGGRTGVVDDGGNVGQTPPYDATRSPLDAYAAASQNGLEYLDRSIGPNSGRADAVVDNG